MARISQPREAAELKGADKRNPQRYRNEPPKSKLPVGNAPAHMEASAKAVWFELETFAIPGVLTEADRYFMEMAANLISEYRSNPIEFPTSRFSPMIQALSRLGMSPADRQKLSVDKPKEKNPFQDLDA